MTSPNIYGYLRISTDKQNIENGKKEILFMADNLNLNATVNWVQETCTGKKHWKKRELGILFEKFKSGDVFITTEISRIGRSTLQILEFVTECSKKKVSVYCTKGNLKIDDSVGSQALIFAMSISAQIERDLISERTKAALHTKMANGFKMGRPVGKLTLDKHIDEIKKMMAADIRLKTIAKKFNVTRNTLGTFLKKRNLKQLVVVE